MLTEQEIADSTTSIVKDRNTESGKIDNVLGYTSKDSVRHDEKGNILYDQPQEIDPDDDECYAKLILVQKPDGSCYTKRYVKIGNDGFILDPWGIYSGYVTTTLSKRNTDGKPQWKFVEVNENCFAYYMKFLQSRNKAWLLNSEREKA